MSITWSRLRLRTVRALVNMPIRIQRHGGDCNRQRPPGKTAPDFKGAIGVTHDNVEGVDIAVPVYSFSETHYLADSPEGRWRARLFQRRAEWALRRADGVIVTTAALADYVGRFAPRERITLIPNSVDATRFSPAPGESGSAGRQRLIAVGSLTVRKNHNLLVEAVALTGRDKIEVVILGTGPEEETLRRLAADKRVTLELPGIVPNEQLPEWLRRADAYLITSHHEGHPKSLLEAMSVGLPCIGTDVPGIRDVLVEGETGRLCPSEPAPLAAAINAVLSDRQVARAIGVRARRFILENHDARVVIAREIAFLKMVARRSTSKETV